MSPGPFARIRLERSRFNKLDLECTRSLERMPARGYHVCTCARAYAGTVQIRRSMSTDVACVGVRDRQALTLTKLHGSITRRRRIVSNGWQQIARHRFFPTIRRYCKGREVQRARRPVQLRVPHNYLRGIYACLAAATPLAPASAADAAGAAAGSSRGSGGNRRERPAQLQQWGGGGGADPAPPLAEHDASGQRPLHAAAPSFEPTRGHHYGQGAAAPQPQGQRRSVPQLQLQAYTMQQQLMMQQAAAAAAGHGHGQGSHPHPHPHAHAEPQQYYAQPRHAQ